MNNVEQFAAPVASLALILFIVLMVLAVVVVSVFLWCRIFSKTDYSWAMGLIVLVPFGNLIVILILAFSDWPVLKELSILKDQN